MPAKVIETAEVSLFNIRYPVIRGVRPFLLNQKIAQIVTGEGDPSLEDKAAKWHIHNTRGGIGRYRINLGSGDTADKFFDSSCRTDTGEITLLPLATEGIAMGAAVTAIQVGFGGNDYFFAGTVIRRFNGTNYQFYCTVHSVWETDPVTGGHTAQAAPAAVVSACVYNGKLYIWCTSDYLVYNDSTTWTSGAGHGGAITGTYAVEWDGNLVKVNATGAVAKSTDPDGASPTWTAIATIYDAVPTGITVYEDAAGDPAVHVGTVKGPYIVDYAAGAAYRLQIRFSDAHADNCRGLSTWDDGLVFGKGGNVRRYLTASRGAQVQDMGPNRDDGLISTKVGRVVALETTMERMLIAAVDAGTGTSSIWLWRDQGWHALAEADVANESIRCMGFSTITTIPRVWFGQGSSVWWIPWYDTTANPLQQGTYNCRASGDHITAWLSNPGMRNTGIDLRFRSKGISSTETVTVRYGLNDDDSTWNLLGTVARNGNSRLQFSTSGKDFYSLRFKLSLARGSTTTERPRILTATLRWTPAPLALWGFAFEVDTSQPYGGRQPEELISALEDACGGTMGVFAFRPNDDRYVRVEAAQAVEQTGHDWRGRWAVTVTELIPVEAVLGGYALWNGTAKWDGTRQWK